MPAVAKVQKLWKDGVVSGRNSFLAAYDRPVPLFNMIYVRLFVCIFFVWKILSRDFEMFGTLPDGILYYYPYRIYSDYMLTTGLPGLMELATFHWIHWLTGMPDAAALHVVKWFAVAVCVMHAVFGAGPKRILAVLNYALVMYLWGFLFMFGQDFDAVYIYQGVLFCLMFTRHDSLPLWRLRKKHITGNDIEAGRSFSAILLIFVLYYFGSGINKLSDISFAQWFDYNLVGTVELALDQGRLGYMSTPFEFFSIISGHDWINYIAVPAVYISHLLIPLVFFRRIFIYEFALFYFLFHFITMAVAIAFTGYLFVWAMLFNVSGILAWLFFRAREVRP